MGAAKNGPDRRLGSLSYMPSEVSRRMEAELCARRARGPPCSENMATLL